MQHLDDLKKRVSTAFYVTGNGIHQVSAERKGVTEIELKALEQTTICLIIMDDGISHVGMNQKMADDVAPELEKSGAYDDALGNAYIYYEALASYPDTTTAPLNFETQDGCPND